MAYNERMEREGYQPEMASEPEAAPSFESELAIRALVDNIIKRSDRDSHIIFEKIYQLVCSEKQTTA